MAHYLIWAISLMAIAGVIIRPFRLSEMIWALSGAILLWITGLISSSTALAGIRQGTDVYLFLTGMMLLAEVARQEKLFDWIAQYAISISKGSSNRLFLLVYLAGIIVTIFLSNDATAVVLTPAVAAAMRTAKIKESLPYLLICAFIANAASFLLPIANPANLVIYNSKLPSLMQWFHQFLVPAAITIIATYLILKWTQREKLSEQFSVNVTPVIIDKGGKLALIAILVTVGVLLTCSVINIPLGLPTFITGLACSFIICIVGQKSLLPVLKHIAWDVLILVAGLFVIVAALTQTGVIHQLTELVNSGTQHNTKLTAISSGTILAIACNLMNNLPVGLIAGHVVQLNALPEIVRRAVLIGIDLGPNLSVTGSLATILWLTALKREGIKISGWQFLKIGIIVMTLPLLLALLSLIIL